MKVVMIDPGHGMGNAHGGVYDPGAVAAEGRRVWKEAEMVMNVALDLAIELNSRGFDARLTRHDQAQETPLNSRQKAAKREGAICLLSIHMNAADDTSAHGWETFSVDGTSRDLAREISDRVTKVSPFRNRGNKDGRHLAVCKGEVPAVLLEAGFITNVTDRQWMADPGNVGRLVDAIADGVEAWASRV